MAGKKPQTLKGFRDYLPEQMAIRNEVIKRLKGVFEKFGFEEMQTPALEYKEVLTGKYGVEAEKLMYTFKDLGGREIGLRYDLTIPLARVTSSHPDLTKPFRAFRMQPAWRAEKPQKGRYRELFQCDFDVIGSSSHLADAEIIAILNESFTSLGFLAFKIRLSSREVLSSILKTAEVDKDKWVIAIQSIDKLDKLDQKFVEGELNKKGIGKRQVDQIFAQLNTAKPDESLENTMKYAARLGVVRNLQFDARLARGLDYYTGPIYEVVVDEPKIGSLAGGGRYDNLIKDLGGPNLPATGASIGLDRVVDVIQENTLWKEVPSTATKAIVTIFSDKQIDSSIEAVNLLRNSGISAELYPDPETKLEKQLKYAAKKRIPFAVIIGPDEVLKKSAVLKNLTTKKQEKVPLQALLSLIK